MYCCLFQFLLYGGFLLKKNISFANWIGLKSITISNKATFLCLCACTIVLFAPTSIILDWLLLDNVQLASSRFYGAGAVAIIPIIIFAFIKTGLSEEIFFRGFLCKRLSARLGFSAGNSLQALIFGFLHGATLFSSSGIVISITIVLFTGGIGWIMGYINEKLSNGSIVPSWCLHGVANVLSGLIDACSFI
jgi:membrane protease YdiL (CAAX protease family)